VPSAVDDSLGTRQLYCVPDSASVPETFTSDQRRLLEPYFGNTNSHVFVLTNLPEVVKGALFARYSRSAKTVRQLFLDEFADDMPGQTSQDEVGLERAERLYERIFGQYGDDSVAQLGGAHLACEGVSNVLTKVLERGRLMSYLEQSTRYVPYTDRPGGQWKYVVPTELTSGSAVSLRSTFSATLDHAFETYTRWIRPVQAHFRSVYPKSPSDPDGVYNAAIRAKTLDVLRGLLPAATRSNVGLYGSGQAYEALLLRMRATPLSEAREVSGLMLPELRKVIPAFLVRVDRPDRGVRWSRYLAETRTDTERLTRELVGSLEPEPNPEVTLTDFDPDGEIKVVASALYAGSHLPEAQLLEVARSMSTDERIRVLRAYVGERENRRHRPGRAFERASYCFDVLSDYGAFRDLQRHRILSIDWQQLGPSHGYDAPTAIEEVGAITDWQQVMEESADLHGRLAGVASPLVAQYAISMAYRIRFYMHMNAREAMHVIELRTSPQGHPAYRRVCQTMHRLINEQAGHHAVAAALTFVDHSGVELERLEAERATDRRRQETR
jgi:thymidylate synthase ThyX